MEKPARVSTVIIGDGQAGLAMSRWLQKLDIPHLVLERGQVGQSWRQQRWDSFRLNTPNVVNQLPDDRYEGEMPYGFESAGSLPALLDERGRPRHTDGVCDVPGLYCLGMTWLRRRVSGLIAGVDGDAEHVARHIAGRSH